MYKNRAWSIWIALAILTSVLVGCIAPASPAIEENATETLDTETLDEVNVAIVFISPLEEPWNLSLLSGFDRVIAEQPDGLTITYDYAENLFGAEAEQALRTFAETGKYEIIWAHSTFSDQVKNLYQEFPDIQWVLTGSGNEGFGENVYWLYMNVHEPAYLLGITAGMMTETDVVGVVAAYPTGDVNSDINGFIQGAKAANPETQVKVTYIESWFDPPKAKEAAAAQVAAGADFIYAERFGPFEACQELGCMAYGHLTDQEALSPEVVVSSAVALWDPAIMYILDEWQAHRESGEPFNAPTDFTRFLMKDGAGDIASFYDLADEMPVEVIMAVEEARTAIMAGELEVLLDEEMAVSE
ncbi:MAG: BMP family ABC transporter substrate-binding protein [Chloroflexota bacterium]